MHSFACVPWRCGPLRAGVHLCAAFAIGAAGGRPRRQGARPGNIDPLQGLRRLLPVRGRRVDQEQSDPAGPCHWAPAASSSTRTARADLNPRGSGEVTNAPAGSDTQKLGCSTAVHGRGGDREGRNAPIDPMLADINGGSSIPALVDEGEAAPSRGQRRPDFGRMPTPRTLEADRRDRWAYGLPTAILPQPSPLRAIRAAVPHY